MHNGLQELSYCNWTTIAQIYVTKSRKSLILLQGFIVILLSHFRWPEPPEPLQQPPAAEEEAEISHRLHQPPDIRAREAVPLPKVPQSSGPRRDSVESGPNERTGDNMVPKPEGEAQEGHGRTEEGRRERQAADGAQELPGERAGLGDTEEEGHSERGWLSEELGGDDGEVKSEAT